MKKLLGIIAAAFLLLPAFAEVAVGGTINQAFAPFGYDGDEYVFAGPAAPWDTMNTTKHLGRFAVSFNAKTDNAGFVGDIYLEKQSSNSTAVFIYGDNAYGWVKPFDFLKISLGRIKTNWRRVGLPYGAWNNLRPYGIDSSGDDLAFYRPFCPNFALLLTPVEGLEIVWDFAAEKCSNTKAYNVVWNYARYGISYTIPDVGVVMAQVYGKDNAFNKDNESTKWGVIGLAFELKGIENFYLQCGIQAPTSFAPLHNASNKLEKDSAIKAGLGVNVTFEPVILHTFFNGQLVTNDGKDYNEFGFATGGGLDFVISDAYSIITDCRYVNKWFNNDSGKEGSDHIIVYGGIEHKLSNAVFRAGFSGSTNSKIAGSAKESDFTFGIPIEMEIKM